MKTLKQQHLNAVILNLPPRSGCNWCPVLPPIIAVCIYIERVLTSCVFHTKRLPKNTRLSSSLSSVHQKQQRVRVSDSSNGCCSTSHSEVISRGGKTDHGEGFGRERRLTLLEMQRTWMAGRGLSSFRWSSSTLKWCSGDMTGRGAAIVSPRRCSSVRRFVCTSSNDLFKKSKTKTTNAE